MDIVKAIADRRTELIDIMVATADRSLPTPESEVRQFMVGFVTLLEAAAAGNMNPRDEYLETVIPAVRDGGISLAYVMSAMPRLAVALGTVLGREHAPWIANFLGEYTTHMLTVWERR
ncbi:MAG: hypothetical protein QM778_05270 [Myxococcales bacterium]